MRFKLNQCSSQLLVVGNWWSVVVLARRFWCLQLTTDNYLLTSS